MTIQHYSGGSTDVRIGHRTAQCDSGLVDQRLLILGARSLSEEVADLAGDIDGITVAGFVENMERRLSGGKLRDLPVWWIDDIGEMSRNHRVVCGLSTTFRSRIAGEAIALGMQPISLIHPASHVSQSSDVSVGTVVAPGAVIAAHTHVGCHVYVNRNASIGHHTHIGEFVTLGPGAIVAGACRIGHSTYIGLGAKILDGISVGCHSVIGAGAVVTRDVPDHVQVLGIPARITKRDIDGK